MSQILSREEEFLLSIDQSGYFLRIFYPVLNEKNKEAQEEWNSFFVIFGE
jgi:hypothetical protein